MVQKIINKKTQKNNSWGSPIPVDTSNMFKMIANAQLMTFKMNLSLVPKSQVSEKRKNLVNKHGNEKPIMWR